MTNQRLYRSRSNRFLGGVCGGIADYFQIDPTLVRILWLLITFLGGAGVFAYLIAWVIVPERPAAAEGAVDVEAEVVGDDRPRATTSPNREGRNLLGTVLILVGAVFLLRHLLPWLTAGTILPLLLIVIGLCVILRG